MNSSPHPMISVSANQFSAPKRSTIFEADLIRKSKNIIIVESTTSDSDDSDYIDQKHKKKTIAKKIKTRSKRAVHPLLKDKPETIIKRIPNSLKLIIPSEYNSHILMSENSKLVNYRGNIYQYDFNTSRGSFDQKFQIELKSELHFLEEGKKY